MVGILILAIACLLLIVIELFGLITKLSNHLKAPILTDSLSQIRFNSNTLNLYEHYIGRDDIKPDLIIRIGQKPVSKKLCKKISDLKIQNTNPLEFSYLLIDESGRFNDDATTVIKTNYKQFIRFIVKNTEKNKNSDFYNHLHCLEEKVSTIIKNEKEWSELIISKHTLLSIKSKEKGCPGF